MCTIGTPFDIKKDTGTLMAGTHPKFEEVVPPQDVLKNNTNHDSSYFPSRIYENPEHKVWKRTASAYVIRDDDDPSTYERKVLCEMEINGKTFCIDKSETMKFGPWICESCQCDKQEDHCYTKWYLTKTTVMGWAYVFAVFGGIYLFSKLF